MAAANIKEAEEKFTERFWNFIAKNVPSVLDMASDLPVDDCETCIDLLKSLLLYHSPRRLDILLVKSLMKPILTFLCHSSWNVRKAAQDSTNSILSVIHESTKRSVSVGAELFQALLDEYFKYLTVVGEQLIAKSREEKNSSNTQLAYVPYVEILVNALMVISSSELAATHVCSMRLLFCSHHPCLVGTTNKKDTVWKRLQRDVHVQAIKDYVTDFCESSPGLMWLRSASHMEQEAAIHALSTLLTIIPARADPQLNKIFRTHEVMLLSEQAKGRFKAYQNNDSKSLEVVEAEEVMVVSKWGVVYMLHNAEMLWSFKTHKKAYNLTINNEQCNSFITANPKGDDIILNCSCIKDKKLEIKEMVGQGHQGWDLDGGVVKSYVEKKFGHSIFSSKPWPLCFDEVGRESAIGDSYQISRVDNEICNSAFTLQWSEFQARRFQNGIESRIRVYHEFDTRALHERLEHHKHQNANIAADLFFISVEQPYVIDYSECLNDVEDRQVYKGLLYGSEVAVCVFHPDYRFSFEGFSVWKKCPSPYIVEFRGGFLVDKNYCAAFEQCECTLNSELIVNKAGLEINQVVRCIVNGLMDLHEQGISHGCLNPWNVLLDAAKTPKMCGFRHFKKLDETTRRKDLKELADMILYLHGSSFVESESDYPTQFSDPNIPYMAKHAADLLYDGILLGEFVKEPDSWEIEKLIDFVIDSSSYMHSIKAIQTLKLDNSTGKFFDVASGWTPSVPPKLRQWSNPVLVPASPLSLLSFMRNTLVHVDQVKLHGSTCPDAKKFIGGTKKELAASYFERFPAFVLELYSDIKKIPDIQMSTIAYYF